MNQKPPALNVMERLRQIRERAVDEVTGKLSQQQQLCQRYNNNIKALTALSDSAAAENPDAAQLHNQACFKAGIQRVVDWQQQQQALAALHQATLQRELVEHACRERALNTVLEQQKIALQQALQQREQKQTDAQAMQSWLRSRRDGRTGK